MGEALFLFIIVVNLKIYESFILNQQEVTFVKSRVDFVVSALSHL